MVGIEDWPSAVCGSFSVWVFLYCTSIFRLSCLWDFRCLIIAGHHWVLGGCYKFTLCLCCIFSVAGKDGPEGVCTFYISRQPSGQVLVSWVMWRLILARQCSSGANLSVCGQLLGCALQLWLPADWDGSSTGKPVLWSCIFHPKTWNKNLYLGWTQLLKIRNIILYIILMLIDFLVCKLYMFNFICFLIYFCIYFWVIWCRIFFL